MRGKKNTDALTRTSRYISMILRHHPEKAGVSLDEHGWADVDALIAGVSKVHPLTRELLEEIVCTDDKQRYSFSEDGTRIRANQGHSVHVDVELARKEPPEYLFHGTGQKYTAFIDRQGLLPRGRLYVHLSSDTETAKKVGARHGTPVIYRVASGKMARDGFAFFLLVNQVWLTPMVPAEYLEKMP